MSPSAKASSCTGKKDYQTPQIAWRNLKAIERKHGHMVFYRCAFCRQFHIGKQFGRTVRDDDS